MPLDSHFKKKKTVREINQMAVSPHIMARLNYMTCLSSHNKLQRSVINTRFETKIKCFIFLCFRLQASIV